MKGSSAALLGALWMAALNTFGDFIWARFVIHHRMAYGITHGTLLLMALGLFLGLYRGRAGLGAAGGAAVGAAAAGIFYLLAGWLRLGAMLPAWMALWIGFALLDAFVLRKARSWRDALARGAVAAVVSGAAFYAISGIWTHHGPGGPDYAYNFLCWTFAFLPGLLALLVRAEATRQESP
jgi:hypothetical protein